MKTKQENNKNANKKDISAAILKKVNNTRIVKSKTQKAVFFKLTIFRSDFDGNLLEFHEVWTNQTMANTT